MTKGKPDHHAEKGGTAENDENDLGPKAETSEVWQSQAEGGPEEEAQEEGKSSAVWHVAVLVAGGG